MNEIQKLLAEIEDSNNKILADTKSSVAVRVASEQVLGNVNNNACDIAYFLKKLEKLLLTGG